MIKENCCGCYGCVTVCPTGALHMVEDEEGFWYPKRKKPICIHCAKCMKICPIRHKPDLFEGEAAFACTNRDDEVRRKSSSGGVFTLLAERILEQGGVVFGAAMDENFQVVHKWVDSASELGRLRGSKYVQSKTLDSYQEVELFLKEGRIVYFSGTPCQCAGLRTYLGKEYENLVLQDIICHGVPSPLVFQAYLKMQEERYGAKVKEISFRDKGGEERETSWKGYGMHLEFENGEEYFESRYRDLYLRIYSSDLPLRPSCYSCRFKGISRCSDLTLGDFWHIGQLVESLDDDIGTSLILCNHKKGEDLFQEVMGKVNETEVSRLQALFYNPSALLSARKSKERSLFWNGFREGGLLEGEERIAKPSLFRKVQRYGFLFTCYLKNKDYRRSMNRGIKL